MPNLVSALLTLLSRRLWFILVPGLIILHMVMIELAVLRFLSACLSMFYAQGSILRWLSVVCWALALGVFHQQSSLRLTSGVGTPETKYYLRMLSRLVLLCLKCGCVCGPAAICQLMPPGRIVIYVSRLRPCVSFDCSAHRRMIVVVFAYFMRSLKILGINWTSSYCRS